MERSLVLKAVADETRMKVITLLLKHNYCVRALARKLEISEAGISQHLKVLREAGLLKGEKKGYFMHYEVNREVLHELAQEFESLAAIERENCSPEQGKCNKAEAVNCHHLKGEECSAEVREFCHGHNQNDELHYEKCHCHNK